MSSTKKNIASMTSKRVMRAGRESATMVGGELGDAGSGLRERKGAVAEPFRDDDVGAGARTRGCR